MNDRERQMWIDNDEGLYRMWKCSRQPMRTFIRENRTELTQFIKETLNRSPLREFLCTHHIPERDIF